MSDQPEPTSNLDKERHSAAHLLALAVTELYPDVKLGIGPAIEHGFYYDFEFKEPLSPADLEPIEAKMRQRQQEGLGYTREELSIEEAKTRLKKANQPYKIALLEKFSSEGEKTVSFYSTGHFVDLCRGGHVDSTTEIGPFKLTHIAGAYWLGDEKNPMLTRIYAAQFATQPELDKYLAMLEEAKKRDHRKLGRELDLFTFSDVVGAGLPLFTPKGTVLREELTKFIQELMAPHGFERVWIPHITKRELYEISGHWDKFKDDLFHVKGKGKDEFVLKPMNCPHHNQIYASRNRSYRDLPIRYAEVTTNYRDELPGELNGLSRVRSLTQDDGHIYCRPDQAKQEIITCYELVKQFYAVFHMNFTIRLSLRDPANKLAYLGDDQIWDESEAMLKAALKEVGADYVEGIGEAAFYGPKLDIMVEDALSRKWQVATIQVDFNQPERFNLSYTDQAGQEVRPVMIHRAIAGALERFLAIVIEHYAGAFPLWLAPVQVAVLPVSEKFTDYATEVMYKLKTAGFRLELHLDETLGKRIRAAELQKIPYILIIGEKEQAASTVSIRTLKDKDAGTKPVDELITELLTTIHDRS